MGKHGRQIVDVDPQGGVFAALPDRGLTRPVYTFGPKDGQQAYLFQCPISAIPDVAFELLFLWWDLRLLRMPPPVLTPLIRLAFTTFEQAYRAVDPQLAQGNMAAGLMAGLLAKAK